VLKSCEDTLQDCDVSVTKEWPSADVRYLASKSLLFQFQNKWNELVDAFTRCELTRESYRLIAFSGLARTKQSVAHGRYLAGTWETHFPGSLLRIVVPKTRPIRERSYTGYKGNINPPNFGHIS
jgi:hypothetical protein